MNCLFRAGTFVADTFPLSTTENCMPPIAPFVDATGLASALERFAVERDWKQFHSPKNLVMALSGEVGELSAVFQWMSESDSLQAATNPDTSEAVKEEIAVPPR